MKLNMWQIIEECKKRDISQSDLCRLTGISSALMSMYFTGKRDPKAENVAKMQQALMMMDSLDIIPEKKVHLAPVYESVSAGLGIDANSDVVEYTPIYAQSKAEAEETLVIRVKGNSMSPKIEDGDLVQVWKTPCIESGSIGVVLLDTEHGEEGLVKRIIYGTGYIELQSINQEYDSVRFSGQDARKVKVVGVVRRITKIC